MGEAAAARKWYAARSPAVARAFLAELDQAVQRIIEAPDRWPTYLHGTRRYLMHRFPFLIVYRQRDAGVQVVAVAHAKRHPGYWERRR